ncbi:MAG: agmatine deiminase family protein [Bacteroidaceae bacterium]|nr:agmatine deiminase family protein [Bacteroidaceae bacterium]
MPLHYTPTTPSISDLTLHLELPELPKTEEAALRDTFFPAEWHPQSGVQLTWPHAATDWAPILSEVDDCFVRIAFEILNHDERLLIVTPEPDRISALLAERLPARLLPAVRYFECPTNDTWARDHAFLTLVSPEGPLLLDFQFNGWGNKFPSDLDNQICRRLAFPSISAPSSSSSSSPSSSPSSPSPSSSPSSVASSSVAPSSSSPSSPRLGAARIRADHPSSPLRGRYVPHLDFVFEGGSIESDGRGTLLTTSQCLLSPQRNPGLTRQEIEQRLLQYFRARRVLWLDHGYLAGDDTDSHIDTLARLAPSDSILYVQCTDPSDEHYEALQAMEAQLRTFCVLGAAGSEGEAEHYRLLPLPMPSPIYDSADGHRLPATYANFLILNSAVLLPTYGQPANDELARRQLQRAFPRHDIVPVDCRILIRQHGSLHCSTMQYPVGVL